MGDIIKADFSGRSKAKADVSSDKESGEILKSEFEEWLSSSLVYKALKKATRGFDHHDVADMVAHIENDSEWYTNKVLMGELRSSYVPNKDDIIDTVTGLLAIVQVLRKRFGIEI